MKTEKSVSQIIAAHVLTYFNFLNLVLFVLILISGQYKNMLFMGVVVSNALIGIVQELRVKKLIDRLTVMTATKAKRLDLTDETKKTISIILFTFEIPIIALLLLFIYAFFGIENRRPSGRGYNPPKRR